MKQESLSVSVPLGNAVQIGEISLDLSEIKEASKLVVSAGIKGFGGCNSWNVFVYPVEERNENSEIYITENWTAVHAKNLAGENPYCGYRMMHYSL